MVLILFLSQGGNKMSKKNISKCICIMGFILTSGIFFSCGQQGEVLSIETGGSPLETEASVQPESEFQTESKVYVYVCGYVAAPGVYEFEPGHRVIDAIDAAGGFIADAADTYLNLADPLVDGSKLYVPSIEEAIKSRQRNRFIQTRNHHCLILILPLWSS